MPSWVLYDEYESLVLKFILIAPQNFTFQKLIKREKFEKFSPEQYNGKKLR